MSYLFLNLKGEYFDQIKSGEKGVEYRLYNDYWKKRLMNGATFKEWDKIVLRRGYPKASDASKQLMREWVRVSIETITHPHFGDEPVKVFAIDVSCEAVLVYLGL